MLGREGNVVDGVVIKDKDIEDRHVHSKGNDADSSSGGSDGEHKEVKGQAEFVG